MTYRSTLVGARSSGSAVGHATAVTLGASGMDSGHTWVDLGTIPGMTIPGGTDRPRPWRRLRSLFRA
ncbi:hypothetical protein ACPW96_12440 [Micromonospora sp. DT81.3]|uniref:hypothetical protein n=1 Tax=Micromonospora sp. DT81.3 TaxID=3416523 RepID=UPI003CF680D0